MYMKKILFTLFTVFSFITSVQAQTWNMVITHEDGKRDTIQTSAVKNVSFNLPDQNADQVIIKELYVGGCPDNTSTTTYINDKYCILYNNCSKEAVVNNLALGYVYPYNGDVSNTWYNAAGNLSYASENYIPSHNGYWYFQTSLVIEPYSQVVVSFNNSVDNTTTYSNSINFANAAYYAMYDMESGYNNTKSYSVADTIPSSHYLKAVRLGTAKAWPISTMSPAFFIFQIKGTTPAEYGADVNNQVYTLSQTQSNINLNVKIPNNWILDAVEVYNAAKISASKKRFTSDIDAGYVSLTNKLGYTLYRNVDKEATEALAENSGKLVYSYSLGVGTSTDPSGIDAEASIKNGAHIIYSETNNSTTDFHERQKSSLR
jgi:hypothetical protein